MHKNLSFYINNKLIHTSNILLLFVSIKLFSFTFLYISICFYTFLTYNSRCTKIASILKHIANKEELTDTMLYRCNYQFIKIKKYFNIPIITKTNRRGVDRGDERSNNTGYIVRQSLLSN